MNPSQAAPGSQASLREANRQRVLEVLREQGALTQVEVAGLTGLSPATVSNVVKELDAGGAVELAPSIRNGRRAVLVSLATGHSLLAAIAFGERDVRVGIGGSPLELLGRRRMPLPADHRADEGLDRASRLLLDVIEESGKSMSDLRAVAVAVPGPVDLVTGHVGSQGILPGWRDVAVADEVREMVKVPVTVENTANLGALGELRSGALQGIDNGVYVKLVVRGRCRPDPRRRAVPRRPPAPPARWATSPSTRTARSAGAATAGASRPTSARTRCSTPCAPPTSG